LSGLGLGNLTDFIGVFGGLDLTLSNPIIAAIESLVSGIPGVGPLIDLFFNFITGGSGSGHSLGDLSGVINQIPIFGQLISMFVGGGSGLTGASGFGSIISDFLGIFGNPTGLG